MPLPETTAAPGAGDARALVVFDTGLLGRRGRAPEPGRPTRRAPDANDALGSHADLESGASARTSRSDAQQMMQYLAILYGDGDRAATSATERGACGGDHQPHPHGRMMPDPDGHPPFLWSTSP